MATLKLKVRDAARLSKKYPYTRHLPKTQLYSNQRFELEVFEVTFDGVDEVTHNYEAAFSGSPSVTCALIVPEGDTGDTHNVNIYVKQVARTHVVIAASDTFTGKVAVHAILMDN